jgi:hypothetical protein
MVPHPLAFLWRKGGVELFLAERAPLLHRHFLRRQVPSSNRYLRRSRCR